MIMAIWDNPLKRSSFTNDMFWVVYCTLNENRVLTSLKILLHVLKTLAMTFDNPAMVLNCYSKEHPELLQRTPRVTDDPG